jgi:dihydroflavonol-4-reductase
MTPRALITGANGFLGSRLIRLLVTRGERVKAFVRAGSNLSALRGLPEQQVELCMGDVMSGHTVYRALAGCNRLYHLAGGYTPWQSGALGVFEPAVIGTQEVLDAAQRRSIERIVVTSSAATLGSTAQAVAMDEGHDFNLPGAEPALVAKHRAERVALEQARLGLPVVVGSPHRAAACSCAISTGLHRDVCASLEPAASTSWMWMTSPPGTSWRW